MTRFADLVFKEYQQEVLQLLLERPDDSFTVNEIATQTSAAYNTVRTFLDELREYGITTHTRKGNATLVAYDHDNRYHGVLTEVFTIDDTSRHEAAHRYAEELYAGREDEIVSIILFGSTARGTATKDSDIDVLVLTEDGDIDDTVTDHARNREAFKDVVPIVQTVTRFRDNLVHGDRFETNIRRDGIVLAGDSIGSLTEDA